VPRVWTRQPPEGTPIDWAHPWARGLVDCYVGNGRRSPIHNGLLVSSSSTVDPLTDYADGRCYESPSGRAHVRYASPTELSSTNELTMLAICSPIGGQLASDGTVFGYGGAASNIPIVRIGGRFGDDRLQVQIRNDANVNRQFNSAAGAATAAGWAPDVFSVFAAVNSASRGELALWCNGTKILTTATTSSGAITLGRTAIGGLLRISTLALTTNVRVALALTHNRALKDHELERITRSLSAPWGLFWRRRIYVPRAAGGGSEDYSGGGAATVVVAATGAGTAAEVASGGGAAQIIVASAGAGTAAESASGGSAATVVVAATGAGTAAEAATGGGAAQIIVAATGAGTAEEHASGGGAAVVVVSAVGEGVQSEDGSEHYSGGGAAAVVVSATGAGTAAEAATGGGTAQIIVAATGAGTAAEHASGGGAALIIVSAVGEGFMDDDGPGVTVPVPWRLYTDPARSRIHTDPASSRRYTDPRRTRIYRDPS